MEHKSMVAWALALAYCLASVSGLPLTQERAEPVTVRAEASRPSEPSRAPRSDTAPGDRLDSRSVLETLSVPRCPGVEVVIVTEASDANESVATLRGPAELSGLPRRFGSTVGAERVVYVGEHPRTGVPTVWMTRGRRELCQTPLFAGRAAEAAGAATRVEARKEESRDLRAWVLARVERVDDERVRIDRSALETVLEHRELLRGTGVDVTRPPGARLVGVPSGSLPAALGLRHGDRLLELNGFSLGDPAGVLQAWARLRTTSALELSFERDGAQRRLSIEIVP